MKATPSLVTTQRTLRVERRLSERAAGADFVASWIVPEVVDDS